ncbi:hypothetical protein EW145_g3194 [Phellinidium pouzarii]|uniref:T6SS Phospholipase effector Tle1-like catalytic domain-containing protein n=1 Tax=Phellinidium pouzarii TaxID=167371 RepID=A0A4S4L8G9_9AGAM|nr:hypothetical protein EW145_g3194 [Phellinidium pouzarii]
MASPSLANTVEQSQEEENTPNVNPIRTLVVCFGEIAGPYEIHNSNVEQLTAALKKDMPQRQMQFTAPTDSTLETCVTDSLLVLSQQVGLLSSGNEQQATSAYRIYKKDDEAGKNQATHFKKTFAINVKIDFVGVWETVSSVDSSSMLPFTEANPAIKVFRQALALDEQRVKFNQSFFLPVPNSNEANAQRTCDDGHQ